MRCSLLTISLLLTALFSKAEAATNVWTVNCAPLTNQLSDPIVSYAAVSSHTHSVVGSTAFSRTMTGIDGAKNGKATTCDKYTDHSSYWAPSAYRVLDNGTYQMLPFTGMVAYYTNYSCDYDANNKGKCPRDAAYNSKAFPPGLKMIAGNSMRRTYNDSDPWQHAILFENGNAGEVHGFPKSLDGGRISGHARFPSCWDGKNLDSTNHQSHMAYPDASLGGNDQGGMCPESHPVALFNIGAEFGWDLQGLTDPSKLIFANGDQTGYGFHADFYMGWQDPDALTKSFNNCNTNTDCAWRSFGAPGGVEPHPTARDPETPAPSDNIGANGPIAALPGNQNVMSGGSTGGSNSTTSVNVTAGSTVNVTTKAGSLVTSVPSAAATNTQTPATVTVTVMHTVMPTSCV